uniref:Uncharacterized protein n=1 Tax=Panagrolaimus sp. ES5 TaxID=591445 RepID=A0AC34FWB0_9BILA
MENNNCELSALMEEIKYLRMRNEELESNVYHATNEADDAQMSAAAASRELEAIHRELLEAKEYKKAFEKQQREMELLRTENNRLRADISSRTTPAGSLISGCSLRRMPPPPPSPLPRKDSLVLPTNPPQKVSMKQSFNSKLIVGRLPALNAPPTPPHKHIPTTSVQKGKQFFS